MIPQPPNSFAKHMVPHNLVKTGVNFDKNGPFPQFPQSFSMSKDENMANENGNQLIRHLTCHEASHQEKVCFYECTPLVPLCEGY